MPPYSLCDLKTNYLPSMTLNFLISNVGIIKPTSQGIVSEVYSTEYRKYSTNEKFPLHSAFLGSANCGFRILVNLIQIPKHSNNKINFHI